MKRAMTSQQTKEMIRSASSYQSDEALLDSLMEAKSQIEQIAICEILKERGHSDLVHAFYSDQMSSTIRQIDDIFSRI